MATLMHMFGKLLNSNSQTTIPLTSPSTATAKSSQGYNKRVDEFRETEYPTLVGTTYLDHAGTTPYAKSAIESWTAELTSNLFGNPHSASAASQLSTRRINDIRLKILRFFNASPEDFDIVFVANATAGIKLVAEAFRDHADGFWLGYHSDAHTSLVGCRKLAEQGTKCFENDDELELWIEQMARGVDTTDTLRLVAYPGQSNMTGRRLPLEWCSRIRKATIGTGRRIYTLLDAASLASTSPLDLGGASAAPDFTALSFYKTFGFPDLGALLVRKESADALMHKRYFAGGTVEAVDLSNGWHAKKTVLHSALEEGTLPFHNILALDHAMDAHARLFRSINDVSLHVGFLAQQARKFLRGLSHVNGVKACEVYEDDCSAEYGPLAAFNLKDSHGRVVSASEVEKLCIVKGIQLRTGGLCNPGGTARHLGLSSEQIQSNYQAGRRCGNENDMFDGQPTGSIRISFGAMSTMSDLQNFVSFIEEYYVEQDVLSLRRFGSQNLQQNVDDYYIESLSVFPIKSCAAVKIPPDQRWPVSSHGLAWDREWCLVHQGTNVALSQKQFRQMALLKPSIDRGRSILTVSHALQGFEKSIEIDIRDPPSTVVSSASTCAQGAFKLRDSKVCGDTVAVQLYMSSRINDFFSEALRVPCCLARCLRTGSARNAKIRRPATSSALPSPRSNMPRVTLANESPMLIVSRSSVDELNKQIRIHAAERGNHGPITVSADSFRGNIVVAQHPSDKHQSPYAEDGWSSITISSRNTTHDKNFSNSHLVSPPLSETSSLASASISTSHSIPGSFESSADSQPDPPDELNTTNTNQQTPTKQALKLNILGPCQRCQMLSINQFTAKSQQEPFSTLVKTRRRGDGRVWFGVHAVLQTGNIGDSEGAEDDEDERFVQVGDLVRANSL